MSDFRKALLFTAIPIAVVSVISAVGTAARGTYDTPFFFLWAVAALMLVIAVVVAIVFALRGNKSVAAGTLAGIGIGIVSLGVSFFANLNV